MMADNTSIEWADASWSPIRARAKEDMVIRGHEVPAGTWGYHCERISPGCVNCYASTMNGRMLPAWGTGLDFTVPNREKVEIFLDETELLKPLKWKKQRRIFVESMSDWCATFVTDEMRDRILAVAALCPQHTFLFLTKRAKECAEYFGDEFRTAYIEGAAQSIYSKLHPEESWESVSLSLAVHERNLRHCHLGFSAENQQYFDERWSHMRRLAAAGWNVWCSAEPLLGPIDMRSGVSEVQCANHCDWMGPEDELESDEDGHEPHCPKCGSNWFIIDRPEVLVQVVVGGESGHGARPMNLAWARDIVQQCKTAGVACFVRQMGAKPVRYMGINGALELQRFAGTPIDREYPLKLRNKTGSDMSEWPEDLRVRQFPEAR